MGGDIWFTSDTHYGHKNIIGYCDRPYDSVYQMNQDMIANYNALVGPNDTVWHIGDVAFGGKSDINDVLWALNGKIHLVLGNHDFKTLRGDLLKRFESVQHYAEINFQRTKIVMCHFPFSSWHKQHRGSINLHGHSHGKKQPHGKRRLDVGVDCHEFYPIHIREAFDKAVKNGGDPSVYMR